MAVVKISNDSPTVYGFDAGTDAEEVSNLIDSIREDLGVDRRNKIIIYVLSGTHGSEDGSLEGSRIFFLEDKSKELQTVKCVNVNEKTPENTWNSYFSRVKSILILAWC